MNGGRPSESLTFHWANREPGSLLLAGLIFVSLILHSAAFFLFRLKEQGFRAPPRSAPSVQLLTPFAADGSRSAENEALLEWIATQDPALVAAIPGVEPKGLLDVPYRPSFQTIRTHPLGVPPEPAAIQFPPPRDPVALIRGSMPAIAPGPVIVAAQPTQVTVSASLTARAPADLRIAPEARAGKPVGETTVLVGVAAKGEVRYAFLQQASGSAELDREAAAAAEKMRFAAAAEAMQWGIVTFLWGDDAFANPAPQPSPP